MFYKWQYYVTFSFSVTELDMTESDLACTHTHTHTHTHTPASYFEKLDATVRENTYQIWFIFK